ncbi:hypothetical protein DRP07_00320 [Archaeoglobales archaeon]|nr:MAG: hypothetical protein DRP07_00320 [Archaeoglobales archaeon]
MEEDGEVVERTITIKNVSQEICERELNGFFEGEGVCRVKIREDKRKPGQIEIIKMRPEAADFR